MEEAFALLVPIIAIAGGILLILMAMHQHTRRLEMRHRERMAMIERGLMPSPERDPAAFDAQTQPSARGNRSTSLGIAVVAIGLGLMLLIGVAGGAPAAAIGVGGAVAVLGAAFIVNGRLQAHAQRPPPSRPSSPPPIGHTDPPGPVGP